MSLRMQFRRIMKVIMTHDSWLLNMQAFVSSESLLKVPNHLWKCSQLFCVHAWKTNTPARVNLYEMSPYKSCWRWSVSQFLHAWASWDMEVISFWSSQTDSQMYTFPDQRNWHFVQKNGFQITVKTLCTGHRWLNTNDLFIFCWGKNLLGIV